jgi:hypothetical protein
MMQRTPSYKTPTEVKVMILGVALAGLLLQIGQLALFFLVLPWADVPLPLNFTDKVEITYENTTNQTVYIYIENRLETTVPAHGSVMASDWKIAWWFGRRIEARDTAGRVLFATKLDKDDLKNLGYRVTIKEP